MFHVELNRLPLIERTESFHLNIRLVAKQIFAAVIGRDKTEALGFGFITPECSLNDYGVVLQGVALQVDEVETQKRRAAMSGSTKMFHRGSYFEGEEARR